MNKTKGAIAPKSSQSCLNCKAEIERVVAQIAEAEKELDLLRLSNKFYTDQDIDRKNKLGIRLDVLRSLLCELKTASKFEVGMWVKNGTLTPGEVKGLYLVDSFARVAVLYDGREEVKHERPAQLTAVDRAYLEYIWTGENYPKLIRRGDKKECADLKVLAENYNSSINTSDTHRECEAEPEDIELYDKQAVWCKKQYQKITRDRFRSGTKVKVNIPQGAKIKISEDKLIGIVQPYCKRNPAYLQKVEVKLDNGTVQKFYPTQISIYQESKAKIIEFCAKPTIQTIPIADIRRNGGTQQRTGLNHEVVKEYAEAMRQGDKFPPVKLKYDGSNYWLTDGFHTTEAAWSLGQTNIEAEVSTGSQREAILISVGVNSNHGLRRSNADKRRAVTTLLNDEEWGQWSDREIARRCKVSNVLVSKLRKEIVTVNINSENLRSYKDKHGNTSQMNTENIGSVNQQKVLTVEPETLLIDSTDKPEALQIDSINNQDSNCPDKKDTVQINCPDKISTVSIIDSFEVGQVVIIDSDRSDRRLIGHNQSYAVITAINPASVDLKLFGYFLKAVSPNDIKPVDEFYQFTVCLSVNEHDLAELLIGFDSKEEIAKAAIAARSLNLQTQSS